MRGDIVLSGFVLTADEWAAMDRPARAQLLRAALRRDEPWMAAAPAARRDEADDAYADYQLTAAPA